jgi:O-acetyl-ADP-ribose deacetylase (regulator of RNase III)
MELLMVIKKIIAVMAAFAICGSLDAIEKPKADVVVLKDGTVTIRLNGSSTKIEIPVADLDITSFRVQAIVNPANDMLQHGGGVAAAISKAAGPKLQEWSNEVPICWKPVYRSTRLPTGHAMISPSFDLVKNNIRAIIHTVGPNPCADEDQKKNANKYLYDAWYNALKVASGDEWIKTIAFPSISTGIFGFPKERAGEIALQAIVDFIQKNPCRFKRIYILLWSDTRDAYVNTISTVVEPTFLARHPQFPVPSSDDPHALCPCPIPYRPSPEYQKD